MKNMLSLLAFDNRSVKSLLSEANHDYFSNEFPIIYKNAQSKSAVDIALDANQVASVQLMIDYVVVH